MVCVWGGCPSTYVSPGRERQPREVTAQHARRGLHMPRFGCHAGAPARARGTAAGPRGARYARRWMLIRQLAAHTVAQLKGAAPTRRTVTVLAPNMLASAQLLPQNRGKLCPLVPEGETLPSSLPIEPW